MAPPTMPSYEQIMLRMNALVTHRDGEWCGMPLPLPGLGLVLEDRHPYAAKLASLQRAMDDEPGGAPRQRACRAEDQGWTLVNEWHGSLRNGTPGTIMVIRHEDGRTAWSFEHDSIKRNQFCFGPFSTLDAWSLETEITALEKLAELLNERMYKAYILTGGFLETSPRSGPDVLVPATAADGGADAPRAESGPPRAGSGGRAGHVDFVRALSPSAGILCQHVLRRHDPDRRRNRPPAADARRRAAVLAARQPAPSLHTGERPMSTGSLSVLNVGAGDIEIKFNQHDDDEAQKALRMLQDMQARGYAIMVRDEDGKYTRATSIDATRGLYVVTLAAAQETPADAVPRTCECGCGGSVKEGKRFIHGHATRGRGKRQVGVPMARRHATGVARSAGG
jgi:hypothetical protein